jgi:spore maturation protein CgeB
MPSNLKALIVGPDFFGYNQSISRALEAQNYTVEMIETPTNTPKGLLNRVRIDLFGLIGVRAYYDDWRKKFNKRLLEISIDIQPDLLLIIKGDWIDPETFLVMPARKKAIWFQDSVRRCGPHHLDHSHIADGVYVFEGTDINYLEQAGVKNAVFLPMGFDQTLYSKSEFSEQSVDISFVGRMYEERKKIIHRLVEDFPDKSIEIWGRYVRYREPKTWLTWLNRQCNAKLRATFRNRNISPHEVNALYNRSRIVLNIHHKQSSSGCNPRTFEIIGANAFEICDRNEYAEKVFSGNLVQFHDYEDLKNKVSFYLENKTARVESISKCKPILKAHSFDARIQTILATVGLLVVQS